MAQRFFNASPYKSIPFDREAIKNMIEHLIINEDSIMIVSANGFVAGTLTPLFFAPSTLIAAEIAWWSEGGDGEGTDLREAFEERAHELGASGCQFSTLNNELAPPLAKHLVQNGYTPVEVAYLKPL